MIEKKKINLSKCLIFWGFYLFFFFKLKILLCMIFENFPAYSLVLLRLNPLFYLRQFFYSFLTKSTGLSLYSIDWVLFIFFLIFRIFAKPSMVRCSFRFINFETYNTRRKSNFFVVCKAYLLKKGKIISII